MNKLRSQRRRAKTHTWVLLPVIVLLLLVYVLPEPRVRIENENLSVKTVSESDLPQPNNGKSIIVDGRLPSDAAQSEQMRMLRYRERLDKSLKDLNESGLNGYLNGYPETESDLLAYYDDERWMVFYHLLGYADDDVELLIVLRNQSISDKSQQGEDIDPSLPPHTILVEMLASNVVGYLRQESGVGFEEVLDYAIQDLHQSYAVPKNTILTFAHLYLLDELDRRVEDHKVALNTLSHGEDSLASIQQFVAFLDTDDSYVHQQKDSLMSAQSEAIEEENDAESETIE